ncbi:MAG: sugar transporter, partial [Paracoccaceae bacterium]
MRIKKKYRVIEVAPMASGARLRLRHIFVLLGFLLFTVAPTVGAGYYLYTYAADQYASKVGFTVRKEEASSALDILGGLTNISNASSSDTDILYEFIQSQELVMDMDARLDLRAMYTKPTQDPVFALRQDASIEDLMDYWDRMVRILYAPGTGLIEVEARAFDPDDAQRIAQALFERSSEMINGLSSIARADMTTYAKQELDQAVVRLKQARAALTSFRNETQIVDPTADIQGQMGLLNSLQAQL